MISKIKKKLLYILFSLAVLLIWGSGIYYGQYIIDHYQSVSVRIEEDKVTKRALFLALEHEKEKNSKDIPSITAWNLLKKQTIANKDFSTTTSQVYEVYGDIKQVYPMELIKGSLVNSEDYKGCLIDEKVAYNLFGTINAVGNYIIYQDKQYCIRGIIKTKEPTIMIQVYDEDNAYSNLELIYENKDNGKQLASDFMFQNCLADSYTVIEGCFFAKILELFCRVPAWFLGFYILYRILKMVWKRRSLPLQVIVLLIGFMVAFAGLTWIMEFQIYFPNRLIPTKWSDFSFWTEKYKTILDEIDKINYVVPLPKDIIMMQSIRHCIYYILTALAGIIIFVTHRKVFFKNNSGFRMSLLAIVMEGIAIFILFKTGKIFRVTKGYLYMIPLFIILVDCTNKGEIILESIRNKKLF